MTAGEESTKVQLATGGKAVSSNHGPGSQAELGLNQTRARSEFKLYRNLRHRSLSGAHVFLLTHCTFLWRLRSPGRLLCAHTQALVCIFPPLSHMRDYFFPFSFLGLPQQCVALRPHTFFSFCLNKMIFKYYLKNQ